MVGAADTAPPAGPIAGAPMLLRNGFGSSPMMNVFHRTRPVIMSRAATLPRNVQQAYRTSSAALCSLEETPTYRRCWYSVGAPTIRASGCVSTCVFQSRVPFCASRA